MRDQFRLLLKNVDMVVNIRTARLLRQKGNLRDQLTHIIGTTPYLEHHPLGCQNGSSVVDTTQEHPSRDESCLRYKQIFPSPWLTGMEYEQKYSKLLQGICELRMDHNTTTLLACDPCPLSSE